MFERKNRAQKRVTCTFSFYVAECDFDWLPKWGNGGPGKILPGVSIAIVMTLISGVARHLGATIA